jgi:hypothetical protein
MGSQVNCKPPNGGNLLDYGTVTYNGKTIHLTQQAYANNYGTDGDVRYYAHGIDDNGVEYRVAWSTTAAWDAEQDAYQADPENFTASLNEEDACDWTDPVEAREL